MKHPNMKYLRNIIQGKVENYMQNTRSLQLGLAL